MRRRAFTLVELLLVIVLLGIVLAFTLPDYGRMMRARSLVESGDRLRSMIAMTHARAMQDGLMYRVYFPGAPDPHDPRSDSKIDIPWETKQPVVERQKDPLQNPEWFEGFEAGWKPDKVLMDGTRCVAVLPGRPNFEIDPANPIAGPSIGEGMAEFARLTFRPDGTTDWVTFVLTDLPPDIHIEPHHVSRIINVIVDGRTGQAWMQRALTVEEVELMREHGASPILHMDFTSPQTITEDNILRIQINQGSPATGGRRAGGEQ